MNFEKRCQWCGKSFIAHKMTTLYCSKSCTDKAYKAKQKKKVKEETEREQQTSLPSLGCIGDKPYLTPYDVSILLEVSLATVYRYMAQGVIKAFKFKQRTRIRRTDLDAIFEDPTYKKRGYHKNKISEVYTMKEIMEKDVVNIYSDSNNPETIEVKVNDTPCFVAKVTFVDEN